MSLEWLSARRMEPVLQAEAAECGLAAIVMVAGYHGHRVNLSGLRLHFPTSIKGATLEQLMAIAAQLELAPRPVRLELEELPELQLPAILHWDLNHFVVLESVKPGKSATILDPAVGRRVLPMGEVSKHFTGVALELAPTASFQPVEARRTTRLSDLWSRMTNFRGALAQVITLSAVMQFTALLTPFYIQIAIDEAFPQADTNLLLLLMLGFGAVYVLGAVTQALREWVMLSLGQSLSFHMGGNVVRHLIRLPLAYFERRHIGDLMSRIGSIQPIQQLLAHGIASVVIDAALVVTTIVVMVFISPILSAIVIGSTLLYIALSQAMYPALRRRSEEEIHARAGEESYLMETIRAIRSVKIHGHEAQREGGWRNRYADVIRASYKTRRFAIGLDLGEGLLFNLALVACIYIGGLQVISGTLTVGTLLAFLSYRGSFAASAVSLVDKFQEWRLVGLHLDRLSDIVTETKEDFPAAPRRELLAGPEMRIEDLSFTYDPTSRPVFDGIDLKIPSGAFVAFVGPSGAGKTTLMRILLGLLTPGAGTITVDGVRLSPATMAGWRARIGAVMQDDCLLTGTIEDNIAFFDASAKPEDVVRAAMLAAIHDDIVAMPMGYRTLIGDMGAALSAGQRQRVMLARALFRDPDILFLDEGTANLDPDTEVRIADMISGLPITRIVIAHRPALIDRAEIVIRVDGGKAVVERRTVPGRPRSVEAPDW
ncbi:peptidase domain-containing ABC transporter [uncultured Sphingomonas sp.]|uniref:peptidase domain-containing ABC transporter n=1 Tax=uncultured Sphingomonas sp. TaxID=158754 RepID=UPI0025FB2F4D|nr:peptidase domain-containing ABC transporter [uncultured Sphingomonas sp.]